jgi:hypothetical protein
VALAVGASVLASAALAGAQAQNSQRHNPVPEDAQKAILAAFGKYEVVGADSPNDLYLDVIPQS